MMLHWLLGCKCCAIAGTQKTLDSLVSQLAMHTMPTLWHGMACAVNICILRVVIMLRCCWDTEDARQGGGAPTAAVQTCHAWHACMAYADMWSEHLHLVFDDSALELMA
jgi:hypothetical protein